MRTKLKINPDTGKVEAMVTFHPVDGSWMQFVQLYNDDGSTTYYTNGTMCEHLPAITEDLKNLFATSDEAKNNET